MPAAFELWLNDKGLSGLDAGVRSQLAAKLSELGADKPTDLAELQNRQRDELAALVVTPIHKERFERAIARAKGDVLEGAPAAAAAHDLPEAFVSWLDAEKLGGLDASMRSKLAGVLKALGAEEPGDLAGLGEDDITDLRALVAEMKTIPKRRFEAALTKILSVPE